VFQSKFGAAGALGRYNRKFGPLEMEPCSSFHPETRTSFPVEYVIDAAKRAMIPKTRRNFRRRPSLAIWSHAPAVVPEVRPKTKNAPRTNIKTNAAHSGNQPTKKAITMPTIAPRISPFSPMRTTHEIAAPKMGRAPRMKPPVSALVPAAVPTAEAASENASARASVGMKATARRRGKGKERSRPAKGDALTPP